MSGSLKPLLSSVCPQCKHENSPRFKSMTLAMTCAKCGTYFPLGSWTTEMVRFNYKKSPCILPGQRATFNNFIYEVAGYVVKQDRKLGFKWREYTLFNPLMGIAFLSEYDGQWNFIVPLDHFPPDTKSELDFNYKGDTYQLFQKSKAKIVLGIGEFFFDTFSLAENMAVEEYISPPNLLSLEQDSRNYKWYKGEYITPEKVAAAFKMDVKKLPKKIGRGYTQPQTGSFSWQSLTILSLLLASCVICFQFYLGFSAEEKVVYRRLYVARDLKEGQKMFTTPSFELKGASKNLVVNIFTSVSNDWFYGEYTLVNETDQTEYDFSKEIEYYSGVDGGESWSEGSNNGEATLSKIPAGKYHVNIYPQFSLNNSEFTIEVVRDVATTGNMWLTLIFIGIFPTYYLIRRHSIERQRWSESNFSPYEN